VVTFSVPLENIDGLGDTELEFIEEGVAEELGVAPSQVTASVSSVKASGTLSVEVSDLTKTEAADVASTSLVTQAGAQELINRALAALENSETGMRTVIVTGNPVVSTYQEGFNRVPQHEDQNADAPSGNGDGMGVGAGVGVAFAGVVGAAAAVMFMKRKKNQFNQSNRQIGLSVVHPGMEVETSEFVPITVAEPLSVPPRPPRRSSKEAA